MRILVALFALLFSSTALARSPICIEEFYDPADGEDFLPAWDRVQASWLKPAVGNENLDKRRFRTTMEPVIFGCTRKQYPMSGDMHVFGAEVYGQGGDVEIIFTGCGGVRTHSWRYVTGTGGTHESGYGGPTRFRDLAFVGKRDGGCAAPGLVAKQGLEATNVTVRSFGGGGWVLSADVTRPEMSNLNSFTLIKCAALKNGGDGLFIDGGDANAGYTLQFRAEYNDGWGIWDSSFLGNVHVQPKVVHNGIGGRDPTNENLPAMQMGILVDDPGSSVCFLNPYVEGFEAVVDIAGRCGVHGGIGGAYSERTVSDRGSVVRGMREFRSPNGFARFNNLKSVLDLGTPNASTGNVYSLSFENGFLELERGRVNAQRALSLTSSASFSGGRKLDPGRLTIPQGWYEGPTYAKRMMGPGAPPTPTPDMGLGSTWTTTLPARGKPLTWILLKPATEFIWVPLHVIPE